MERKTGKRGKKVLKPCEPAHGLEAASLARSSNWARPHCSGRSCDAVTLATCFPKQLFPLQESLHASRRLEPQAWNREITEKGQKS